MSTDEDERARAYQAQQRRLAAAARARQRALIPADHAPAKAIRDGWQPVDDWQRERDAPEGCP